MNSTLDRLAAPSASNEYREAREKLYDAEKNLMKQVEQVAQMRRESTVAVFSKTGSTLRHTYTAHPDENENTIHGIDLLQPVWHVFDLTPAGRGNFNLRNDYVTMKA